MKNLLRSLTAIGGLLFALLLTMGAQAHGPAVSRYRVNELPVPSSLRAGCVEGYVASGAIQRINDFGIVNANFRCYTQADPATATFQTRDAAFVAAPWFGAVELARPTEPGFAFGSTINNRGEIFGFETVEGGFSGVRWTLGGGHERLFFDPACGSLQVGGASDGNGRYVVGWGWRGDTRLPPPLDTLCLRTTWLIRSPDGVETPGPLDGIPAAINAFNVVVGTSDGSAIRYHVPTGQLRVLHAADATHSAQANDINDLGEAAGRIAENTSPPGPGTPCGGPGVAVRWDRDGRESVLPHLPGERIEPCLRRRLRRRNGRSLECRGVLPEHGEQRATCGAVARRSGLRPEHTDPPIGGRHADLRHLRQPPRPDHRGRDSTTPSH